MSRSRSIIKWVVFGLAAMVIISEPALAQTEVEVTAEWGTSTYGSPVVHYVLQHSVNGGDWVTIATPAATVYSFLVTESDIHQVRVAGVDAEGRQGGFSMPSDPYSPGNVDLGPPSQPGKPILY